MRLFKEMTTQPLSSFVLQTLVHKVFVLQSNNPASQDKQRESPRLKAKKDQRKIHHKAGPGHSGKKCGILHQY
jgi:hypothetical protein